jgi:hypothetical protein
MWFKLWHVSIPKRRIFLPLFLFCAYDSSVLQNFKIFTHLLPNFSHKDPRMTELTYHCINFNDRVRKVPKIYSGRFNRQTSGESASLPWQPKLRRVQDDYYLIFCNFSDPIVEVNAVVRHSRHPWVLMAINVWKSKNSGELSYRMHKAKTGAKRCVL